MKNTMQLTLLVAGLQVAGLTTSFPVLAQLAPDAGTSLELLRRQPQPLPLGPALTVPEREMARTLGGQAVQIRSVILQGNTHLTTESVLEAVGASQAIERPLNIDGLRALADQVTTHYREQGYPFARALVPVQDLKDGQLVIQVVEGQYGKVLAKSADLPLAETAQGFLGSLVAGEVIASPALERATLLISDLPGVSVVPVMKPGAQTGAGDLDVLVEKLNELGVNHVFVEAGPTLGSAMLDGCLLDELIIYQAPALLGTGKHFFAFDYPTTITDQMRMDHLETQVFDGDVKSVYRIRNGE